MNLSGPLSPRDKFLNHSRAKWVFAPRLELLKWTLWEMYGTKSIHHPTAYSSTVFPATLVHAIPRYGPQKSWCPLYFVVSEGSGNRNPPPHHDCLKNSRAFDRLPSGDTAPACSRETHENKAEVINLWRGTRAAKNTFACFFLFFFCSRRQ